MGLQKKALALVLAVALVIVSGVVVPNNTKTASAAFEDLSQAQITQAMGAGWNLGNQMEAAVGGTPSETAWGNPEITEDLIKAVKNAGFTSVRIPVSYLSKIGSDSNYTIDSSWLDRVQQVVDYCVDNGLYAIINMHGDGYTSIDGGWLLCGNSDQTNIKKKYQAAWKQIATRFKNYDQHLVFESMNEEFDGTYGNPGTTAYANINAYNQIFVDTVRQTGGNNDKRWLLIPGWNTNINYTADNYGFVLPTDNYLASGISGKRIMVSVHYYDPWDFCGQEDGNVTQWGSTSTNASKVAVWGDESYMVEQFEKMSDKFVANGYPVVVGEYGSIDKSEYDSTNNANRAEFAYKVCKYAKQYGLVPVLWDNGYNGKHGFGVFDRSTYQVTQSGIIEAIMKIYGDGTPGSTAAPTKAPTAKPTTPAGGTETVLATDTEKYETSDASWLLNAKDTDIITLTYKSTVAGQKGWGIMGWGASIDDKWVSGTNYAAASDGTDATTITFTVAELKESLEIAAGSSISYISLSGWNGGYIEKLSIVKSGDAAPTATPTKAPTATPTVVPEVTPTVVPEVTPTVVPEATPTVVPEITPTVVPEVTPTVVPEVTPTVVPEITPTVVPEVIPTIAPTSGPILSPTLGAANSWNNVAYSVADNFVSNRTLDTDIPGSLYGKCQLRAGKVTKNSITLKWNKVPLSDGYAIYGSSCGNANKLVRLGNLNANTTSYQVKKLKKKTYYKFMIIPFKRGGDGFVTTGMSKIIHVVTKGAKYGDPSGVKVKKSKITMKVGKSVKIKATIKKKVKKIKTHRKLSYESDNLAIASVNSSGKVIGVGKGKCAIYVYAQNGISKKVTITVK